MGSKYYLTDCFRFNPLMQTYYIKRLNLNLTLFQFYITIDKQVCSCKLPLFSYVTDTSSMEYVFSVSLHTLSAFVVS